MTCVLQPVRECGKVDDDAVQRDEGVKHRRSPGERRELRGVGRGLLTEAVRPPQAEQHEKEQERPSGDDGRDGGETRQDHGASPTLWGEPSASRTAFVHYMVLDVLI